MDNQEICFVPGGGGHWLRLLIISLEFNKFVVKPITNTFHSDIQSMQVYITHNRNSTTAILFNGAAYFNIFLNFIKKNEISSTSIGNYIDIAAIRAADLLSYKSMKTDIDFNLIFVDENKFIDNLFNILDSRYIIYTKNKDICYQAIAEYKKTCANPELYFDNYDSIEWLGWCLGIIKLETGCLPYTDSIDQAKELLINDRDYYKNYTTDKMVKLNG